MDGCQNQGPFLGPYYNTAPNIQGTQKGTLILTTTHMCPKRQGVKCGQGDLQTWEELEVDTSWVYGTEPQGGTETK